MTTGLMGCCDVCWASSEVGRKGGGSGVVARLPANRQLFQTDPNSRRPSRSTLPRISESKVLPAFELGGSAGARGKLRQTLFGLARGLRLELGPNLSHFSHWAFFGLPGRPGWVLGGLFRRRGIQGQAKLSPPSDRRLTVLANWQKSPSAAQETVRVRRLLL